MQKVGYFGPISPNGQGDRSNYCVPIRRTAQIPTQSKYSDDGLKQTLFPTKNARLLFKSAVFALWIWLLVFRVVAGELTYRWALCRNAP